MTRVTAPAPIELWQIDLNPTAAAESLASLDAQEQARAARFVFERDRDRYRVAHAALRHLLGARVGCPAGRLRFVDGEFGKPTLVDPPDAGWAFNLSHSDDVAWVAMMPSSDGRNGLGVDVEKLRRLDDADALARRLYTHAEQAEWFGTPAADRDRAFLQCWTRKEACLKAIGSGLSIEPESVDAGVGSEPRRVTVPTRGGPVSVDVQSVSSVGGVIGAIATVAAGAFDARTAAFPVTLTARPYPADEPAPTPR